MTKSAFVNRLLEPSFEILYNCMLPKKSLGQNFLVDPNYKRKIISAVLSGGDQSLLEIGPGRGALTFLLADGFQNFWVVEKDRLLAAELIQNLGHKLNLHILHADFLKKELKSYLPEAKQNISVVSNLPYNSASPILIKLLKNYPYFSNLYLMFQKEVAQRLTATPGKKDYSLLTLWANIYSEPKILFNLPPTVFRPKPKVVSSFVHFVIRPKPLVSDPEAVFFWKCANALFQKRRKTIGSTIKGMLDINRTRLLKSDSPKPELLSCRAESLSIKELLELVRFLRSAQVD